MEALGTLYNGEDSQSAGCPSFILFCFFHSLPLYQRMHIQLCLRPLDEDPSSGHRYGDRIAVI